MSPNTIVFCRENVSHRGSADIEPFGGVAASVSERALKLPAASASSY